MINYLEEIGIYQEFKKLKIADCNETYIKNHENLNIEIKSNKEKFIAYFQNLIKKRNLTLNLDEVRENFDFLIHDDSFINQKKEQLYLPNEKKKHTDMLTEMINKIDLNIEH